MLPLFIYFTIVTAIPDVEWSSVLKFAFNEKLNPDDHMLGVQIVKVNIIDSIMIKAKKWYNVAHLLYFQSVLLGCYFGLAILILVTENFTRLNDHCLVIYAKPPEIYAHNRE